MSILQPLLQVIELSTISTGPASNDMGDIWGTLKWRMRWPIPILPCAPGWVKWRLLLLAIYQFWVSSFLHGSLRVAKTLLGQLLLLFLLILLLRAITGSELFPYLTCLHTTTFVLLITWRAKLLNTDWLMKRVFLFFIFLCEEGKITRSRLVLSLPSNSLFNREIVTREVVSSRLRPDQHSRSLNNWGESAAFVILSANG